MTIPIILLPKDQSIQGYEKKYSPTESMYYMMTSDGLKLRKRNELYDCVHDAEPPKNLGGAKESLNLKCKPIPRKLLDEITAFLAEVCRQHDAEGAALLYYHTEKKEWMYVVPEQETAGGGLSVDYETPKTPDGYTLFGSVHSHAKASAFQSGTDHKDEEHFEGIHITVGKLPDNPEYHVRFHACGSSWTFEDKSLLIEPATRCTEFPKEVLEKVKVKKPSYTYKNAAGYHGKNAVQTQFGSSNGGSAVDNIYGFGQDGMVYCQEASKRVPPADSKRDCYPLGKMLLYEKQLFIKTTAGWVECEDDPEFEEKKTARSNSSISKNSKTTTPTGGEGSTGKEGATDPLGKETFLFDEREEGDTEEILDLREAFFGNGCFGDVRNYCGMKYEKTLWGWENEWESNNGQYVPPRAVRKMMVEMMDIEDQSRLVASYQTEMLTELFASGWSPQDMLMSIDVHESADTQEAEACGTDS